MRDQSVYTGPVVDPRRPFGAFWGDVGLERICLRFVACATTMFEQLSNKNYVIAVECFQVLAISF